MTNKQKKIIKKNRNYLTSNIDIEDGILLDHLVAHEALVKYDVDCIKESESSEKKASNLIDRLLRKSDKAYEDFVECLRKSNQSHLADLLENTKCKYK